MNIEGIHDQRPDYHHRPRTVDPTLTGSRPLRSTRRRSSSTATGKQSTLQIRASNIVKKFGTLTSKLGAGTRSKQRTPGEDADDPNVKPHQPFRKTRSMDILRLRSKQPPFMAAANSNPLLVGFDSQPFIRPSSARGKQESETDADADLVESKITERPAHGHSRKPSSSSSNSNSIEQGLAVATMIAGAGVRPPLPSVTGPAPESSGKSLNPSRHYSSPSVPAPITHAHRVDLSNSDHNVNANGRENRSSERQHVIGAKQDTDTADTALPRSSPAPPVSEKDSDREKRPRSSAHPRLSTLPPLNFNFKGMPQDSSQDPQCTQRLSPSVIVRPPPFPILELPALPTPVSESARSPIASTSATASSSSLALGGRDPQPSPSSQSQSQSRLTTTRRGGARLHSMPLLPREGSENEDPDHENCCLDEDEEDGDDDDGMSGEADGGDGGIVGSDDEDDDSSNLHLSAGIHGHGRRTRSRSPNPNPSRGGNAIASSSDPSPTANASSNSSSSFASKPRGGGFSLTFSPRLTLPGLNNSPSLSSLLGSFTTGGNNSSTSPISNAHDATSSARPSQGREGSALCGDAEDAELANVSRDDAADAATPKAVEPPNYIRGSIGNENGRPDYFAASGALEEHESKSQDSQNSGDNIIDRMHRKTNAKTTASYSRPGSDDKSLFSSTSPSSLRTPTARDYTHIYSPHTTTVSETVSSAAIPETFRDKDSSFIPKVIVSGITEVNTPYLVPSSATNTKHSTSQQPKPRRPSIYHHASKSMIELFSVTQAKEATAAAGAVEVGKGNDAVGRIANTNNNNNGILATNGVTGKGKGKLYPDVSIHDNLHSLNAKHRSEEEDVAMRPSPGREREGQGQEKKSASAPGGDGAVVVAPSTTLRRQRSMPTFSTAGEPPPYPSLQLPSHLQRFAPLPREDEGREELPSYSNSIRLAAVMPRKMEFSSPGVPARDRKWRRVHCVLEGTAFRVYDAPPRVSGVSGLSGWWERKMGVGDVAAGGQGGLGTGAGATAGPGATTNIVIGRKEPKRRMKWEEELAAQEEAQAQQRALAESEEGRLRASTPAPNGSPESNERPSKEHKAKRTVAALLHPARSRHSFHREKDRDQGLPSSSSSPSSPRSSFHFPRSSISTSNSNSHSMSVERESLSSSNSNPPSARPSMDLSRATSSSGLSASNSASSSSVSGMSSNSSVSTPSTQTQTRRGHLHTDSVQSTRSQSPARSSRGHSRNNSRTQSLLNPDTHTHSQPQNQSHVHSHSLSQSHDPSVNPYLYHPPDPTELPEPDEKDLIRVYSLQRAESGLASDYLKRKNVVRVRMDGEQFLLQCKDVGSVVEWIEALQAATNVALDLDERPMPKGPIFPRRRRRRRPQQATESGTMEQPSTTTESASGNGSEPTTS